MDDLRKIKSKAGFFIYRLIVFLLGTILLFYELLNMKPSYQEGSLPAFLLFLGFAWIADRLYIVIHGRINIIYGVVIAIAAMLIFGPEFGVFIGAFASLVRRLSQAQFNTTTLFAFGERVILYSITARALIYQLDKGITFPYNPPLTLGFLGVLAMTLIVFKLCHLVTSDLIFSFLSGSLNLKRLPLSLLYELIVYLLTIPLIVLLMQLYRPNDFLSLFIAFSAVIITNLAIQSFMRNIRYKEDSEREKRLLLEILEVEKAIRLDIPLSQLIYVLTLTIRKSLELPYIHIYLQEEGDKDFKVQGDIIKPVTLPERFGYDAILPYLKEKYRKTTVYIIPTTELKEDSLFSSQAASDNGYISLLPLAKGDEILGFFVTPTSNRMIGDSIEFEILQIYAENLVTAVVNSMEYKRVRNNDPLTNLFNHRFFQEELDRQIHIMGSSVALLMIDIDSFKVYNDSYGHPAGDKLLKYLSEFLQEHVRERDVVARYGGEEFAIILPNTSINEAVVISKRIVTAINADQNLVFEAMPGGMVTLSIGVAVYPTHASNKGELIEAADKALYASKRAGKNTCTISS